MKVLYKSKENIYCGIWDNLQGLFDVVIHSTKRMIDPVAVRFSSETFSHQAYNDRKMSIVVYQQVTKEQGKSKQLHLQIRNHGAQTLVI